jgi:membrane protease YdiL (CAAX protease family)
MSNLENANSSVPVPPPPLRTWDFMETTFVSLIAYAVYQLTAGLALTIMLGMQDGAKNLSPEQFYALAAQGRWCGAALIIASPLTIAVLWIAIRRTGREFAEYLALNWPSASELARALVIMAILLLAELVPGYSVDAQYPSVVPLLSVNGAGGLLILLVAGCIAGPIMEEFIVRGFMFRGWSQSFLGPIGAVTLTAAVWALTHTQYDWFGRLWIFVMGLAIGYFRWRSNSTWLAVMSHSAMNMVIFFSMGPYT